MHKASSQDFPIESLGRLAAPTLPVRPAAFTVALNAT